MDNIQTGLMVSAIGLIVTFTALGVFIGVIVLLQKLFPVKKEAISEAVTATEPLNIVTAKEEDSDEALVAILAAAVYLRSRRSDQLGSALLTGPGPYRTSRN
ncbi:MAG: OadG family transporter subunit [Saprospiraceae bacterium]|nr:OadG family transporter subunit [Saprospiraceae bacterium]